MRAIQYAEFGGYDRLKVVEVPEPRPQDGQALVRMRLAAVSPLDDTVRRGLLPAATTKPLPIIPGSGGVGHVVEPGASGLAPGTAVLVSGWGFGVSRDGTWRDYVALPPANLIPLPEGVPEQTVSAMSAGAGYLTAYLALTELVPFAAGQTVLAPGIGGAVGLGSVQVAKALGAATAISTATSAEKAERGRATGHEVIDLTRESLRDGVLRITRGRGVDVVIDGVGGPVTGEALGVLAPGGHLVSVGYSAGTRTTVDVTDLIWRTAHIRGFMFTLFSQPTARAAQEELLALLADKRLEPAVASTFPMERVADAQRHLIEDRPYGRVLLTF